MTDLLPPIIPTEDFWSRQANAQAYSFDCAPFGIPARITANQAEVLAAARLSAGRYSQATESSGEPIEIQIAVSQNTGAPLPDDLPVRLAYAGVGEWITVSAGDWGHCFANLRTRMACVFLSQSLAADVRFVSRYLIDHYVLNLILTEWAMLHASCVLDASRQRLIVMVATHNTGKSTTALRLTRAGYLFLADGMALLRPPKPRAGSDPAGGSLVVGGYPIGEVKLRDDVLALFPEYTGEAVRVREQQKTIVNLRAAHPDRIVESLITPASIHVCFVERRAQLHTQIVSIDVAEAVHLLTANTVYWNDASKLEHNTAMLHRLLRIANLHRVCLGTDPDDIVATIQKLA
ncbi:MAG: hypothetical protein ACRDGG_09540 [Anaerolineae bacterium]